MIVSAPGWTPAELQRATDDALGYPSDPEFRGRGCPPPPAGRVLHYAAQEEDGIAVDDRWRDLRGRRIERGPHAGRVLPDVDPRDRAPIDPPVGGTDA